MRSTGILREIKDILLGRGHSCAVCSKGGRHRDDVCRKCRSYGWSAPRLFK